MTLKEVEGKPCLEQRRIRAQTQTSISRYEWRNTNGSFVATICNTLLEEDTPSRPAGPRTSAVGGPWVGIGANEDGGSEGRRIE